MAGMVQSALKWVYKNILSAILPRKKTVVRASLFALLGLMPFFIILLARKPLYTVPFLAVLGILAELAGLREDVLKQLRWMKRMSGRGPIFWAAARAHKLSVRLGRKYYGDKLDAMPQPVRALGPSTRGAERVMLKWIPAPTSSFSVEKYEVQVRTTMLPHADSATASDDEQGWVALGKEFECNSEAAGSLPLTPLRADTPYEVRMRAVNSKGASAWVSAAFTTKQLPVKSDDGEWAGGSGDGYTCVHAARAARAACAPPAPRNPPPHPTPCAPRQPLGGHW